MAWKALFLDAGRYDVSDMLIATKLKTSPFSFGPIVDISFMGDTMIDIARLAVRLAARTGVLRRDSSLLCCV
jgi:hypothetical protein